MIHSQNEKSAVLINPASVASTATATGWVDTIGYEYASIDVILDSVAAASNNPVTFNLQEGTITNPSSATNISGFVGDTDWTIPNMVTNAASIVRMDVDLRTRERYLTLDITPATTQIIGAVCRLSRAKDAPDTTTEAGVTAHVIG